MLSGPVDIGVSSVVFLFLLKAGPDGLLSLVAGNRLGVGASVQSPHILRGIPCDILAETSQVLRVRASPGGVDRLVSGAGGASTQLLLHDVAEGWWPLGGCVGVAPQLITRLSSLVVPLGEPVSGFHLALLELERLSDE